MGINRRNSSTICHDRSSNCTFGQPPHYADELVLLTQRKRSCCGLKTASPRIPNLPLNFSHFVPPGNTTVHKPCKSRSEHHPRRHPGQSHEGRSLICCDANLITVLIDGIYHLHDDSCLDTGSDAKGKECQLAKSVSIHIHTHSDHARELTKSITAFRLSLSLPPDINPKSAPMMARPANPTPMQ